MSTTEHASRLTMKEAAAELRHSYSWLHANHRSIGLQGYRIGGRWYFDRNDLQTWEKQAKAKSHVGLHGLKGSGKVVFA